MSLRLATFHEQALTSSLLLTDPQRDTVRPAEAPAERSSFEHPSSGNAGAINRAPTVIHATTYEANKLVSAIYWLHIYFSAVL